MRGRIPMAMLIGCALSVGSAWAGEAFDSDLVRFAPVPPVRGGETVRVRLLALDADGNPRAGLGATPIGGGGRAANWTDEGNGWYAFDFTADREVSSGSVRLRGGISGRVAIPILPQRPARLTVVGAPDSLVVGSSTPSQITVTMPGYPGKIDLGARTSSGTIGVPARSGDASWTTQLTAPSQNYPHLGLVTVSAPGGVAVGGGAVAFRGAVAFPVTGPPGASLSLRVGPTTFGPVVADASGNARIAIEVPPGTREAIQIVEQGANRTEGSINLAPPATRRMAWMPSPGPIPVGQNTALHLLVLEPDGTPDLDAQVEIAATGGTVGRAAHIGQGLYAVDYTATGGTESQLSAAIPNSPIDVDQIVVTHLAPKPATGVPPTSGGAVSAVLLLPGSPFVAPGASSTVKVVAVDRYGYPVPGVSLKVSSSTGTVPQSVNTGGTGVADFAWVAGSTGAATLSAEAKNGVVGSTTFVTSSKPLSIQEPEWTGMLAEWRDRVQLVPPPEPAAPVESVEPPPVEPPQPLQPPGTSMLASARPPILRIRAGGVLGSYTYEQAPNADPGPLIPGRFALGGAEGSRPASAQGVEFDARAWVLPYVGLHVTGRAAEYGFSTAVFSRTLRDWLTHVRAHVNARVPVALPATNGRDNQVWFGVHGGFQVDDFLVFEGCLDPGCQVDYSSVFVPGAEIGADVGIEYGPVYAVASIDQGWAGGRVPYRFGFDLEGGYAFTEQFFVGAGGAGVRRQIAIEGADSGTEFGGIVDSQYYGRVFFGFQY